MAATSWHVLYPASSEPGWLPHRGEARLQPGSPAGAAVRPVANTVRHSLYTPLMTAATPDDEPASGPEPTPGAMERAHTWVLDRWPTTLRRRIAVIAVLVAVGFVVVSTIARLVGAAVDAGILAYIGLMVVCWVGAGGALVPVPGVRPLSWVMIVHQSTVLVVPIVALLAALAMVLGQSSYFLTTRAEARRRREGHGHHRKGAAAEQDGAAPGDSETPGSKQPNRVVARCHAVLFRSERDLFRE